MYEKLRPYITLAMGVIIFILLCIQCESKPIPEQIDNKQTAELIAKKDNQIEKLIAKSKQDSARSDSSHKNTVIIRHHYHTIFDTIYKYAPADCDSALNTVNIACMQLDSANKAVIANKDIEIVDCKETLKQFKERVILTNTQRSNDSTNIVNLHMEVKKQKRTKIAVIVVAILAEIGTIFLLH